MVQYPNCGFGSFSTNMRYIEKNEPDGGKHHWVCLAVEAPFTVDKEKMKIKMSLRAPFTVEKKKTVIFGKSKETGGIIKRNTTI